MSGIQVQIIPEAHHITALAQPELVNARLLKFFDGD
jgi:pimeloyl-ACP methyl ester carboxylesterase